MHTLETISLNNFILFKNTEFAFTDGFTFITGQNKDTNTKKDRVSSNAVGKSLIFSTIPMLAYGSHPSMAKKSSLKGFATNTTAFSITAKINRHNYQFGYQSTKSGVKLTAQRDSKDISARVMRDNRDIITNAFGISEDLFYSMVYVSIYRPSPVWKGNARERFNFFKSVFELDIYDRLYAHFSKELSKMRVPAALIKSDEEKVKELEKSADITLDLAKLQSEHDKLLQEEKRLAESFVKHTKRAAKYRLYLESYSRLHNPTLTLEKAQGKAEKLNEELKVLAKSYKDYAGKIAEYEKALKLHQENEKLAKKIKTLQDRISIAPVKVKDKYRQAKKHLHQTRVLYASAKDLAAELDIYFKNDLGAASLVYNADEHEEIKGKIDFIRFNQRLYAEFEKTKTCPICSTRHKNPPVFSKSLKKLNSRLQEQEHALIKSKIENAFPKPVKLRVIKKRLDAAKAEFDKYKELRVAVKKLLVLTKQMPIEAKLPMSQKDFESLKAAFDAVNTDGIKKHQRNVKLKADIEVLKALDAIYPGKPISVMENNKAKMEKIGRMREQLEGVRSKLNFSLAKITRHKTIMDTVKKIRDDIKENKGKVSDLHRYALLKEACGPKGVKIAYIKGIVQTCCDLLNKYAPLIYSEPYKFITNLENKALDIMVLRNNMPPTDIKYLSGAESHKFLALFAMVLREMLPSERQFNNIIFDEIEGSASLAERDIFYNKFLPVLQTKIKSVTIITPQSVADFTAKDFSQIKKSRIIRVTKSKGFSQLVGA
jgi:DNA repair exonuclease SbcCD ATPase subunit